MGFVMWRRVPACIMTYSNWTLVHREPGLPYIWAILFPKQQLRGMLKGTYTNQSHFFWGGASDLSKEVMTALWEKYMLFHNLPDWFFHWEWNFLVCSLCHDVADHEIRILGLFYMFLVIVRNNCFQTVMDYLQSPCVNKIITLHYNFLMTSVSSGHEEDGQATGVEYTFSNSLYERL